MMLFLYFIALCPNLFVLGLKSLILLANFFKRLLQLLLLLFILYHSFLEPYMICSRLFKSFFQLLIKIFHLIALAVQFLRYSLVFRHMFFQLSIFIFKGLCAFSNFFLQFSIVLCCHFIQLFKVSYIVLLRP